MACCHQEAPVELQQIDIPTPEAASINKQLEFFVQNCCNLTNPVRGAQHRLLCRLSQ